MNYRIAIMHEMEALTADVERYIDLGGTGPYSQIMIIVKGANSDSVPDGPPAKFLDKIEVVDGSEIIQALTGLECQALDFYHSKRPPTNYSSFGTGAQMLGVFVLHFGRWLWDSELALDPVRFKNLQLKLTYNMDGGGSSVTAGDLEVAAKVFDRKTINPIGYLKAWKPYTYTLVADGYETFDLPLDHPIRKIMFQSLTAQKMPHQQYHDIRLQVDNGKYTVVDDETSDIIKYVLNEYPDYVETITGITGAAAVRFFCAPTYDLKAAFGGADNFSSYFRTFGMNGGVIDVAAAAATMTFQAVVSGVLPHGMLSLDQGRQDVIDDWFSPSGINKLEARIKAGAAASGTCQTLVQQLVKY